MATGIFAEYAQYKTRLYPKNGDSVTVTRCQEKSEGHGVVIGCFSNSSLLIMQADSGKAVGISAVQRFY